MELPLVSAIMPTMGRHGWAADAVTAFMAQTYPQRELVILDDQRDPSFFTPPPGSVYYRVPRLSIGAKRNLAISRSTGVIIVHWDSDDVYAPDRIDDQVAHLIESGADLVGYNQMEFRDDERGQRYLYRAAAHYAIGVSFCYWRETWERARFKDEQVGEDNDFLGQVERVACKPAEGRIIARIHAGNTSDKRTQIPANSHQWLRL